MYIPAFNQFTDKQQIISFIKRYSFATIITVENDISVATHLPFLISADDQNNITLLSHFAKANPQGDSLAGKSALVIFMEPHAYISPRNYEKAQNVPTWNYLAVHAYGDCALITGEEAKKKLLEDTIASFEREYLEQWNGLPGDYQNKMMNGITAFKIEVKDLQAKMKLSQNRSETEKDNIIAELSQQPSTPGKDIAGYMSALKAK